jgi:uncharacterized membrane protein YidH (DUF202 family)
MSPDRTPQRAPDGSAAPERTRLAWRRTTLSATAVALLLVRLALQQRDLTVIALTGLSWVFLLAVIQQRIVGLKSPGQPPRKLTMLTALACLALAALGVVLVLP